MAVVQAGDGEVLDLGLGPKRQNVQNRTGSGNPTEGRAGSDRRRGGNEFTSCQVDIEVGAVAGNTNLGAI